jgi:hypothetical protein
MGGNLYKVTRITKERYKEIEAILIPILNKHFGDYYRIPIPYHNKATYGDVDIILDAGYLLNKKWEEPLFVDLDNPQVKKIRNVISVLYMDFQVDFFCVGTSRFHSTYNFMCYNILGNLIGRLYHKFNLKYGEDGLHYVLRGYNNHSSYEVLLTRNMRSMLEFVDLSYERWLMGFDDLKDIYDYVIGSKYFCSNSYSLDYFNVRKRATERPDFNKFLDYLHDNKIEKNYPFDKNKEVYIPLIDQAFPDARLPERFAQHTLEQIKLEAMSKKFNGRIIMELIPTLRDKSLGIFIGHYKTAKGENFDTFVLDTEQQAINNDILNFYNDNKHTYVTNLN